MFFTVDGGGGDRLYCTNHDRQETCIVHAHSLRSSDINFRETKKQFQNLHKQRTYYPSDVRYHNVQIQVGKFDSMVIHPLPDFALQLGSTQSHTSGHHPFPQHETSLGPNAVVAGKHSPDQH
jgi:hypothetical protein